MHAVLDTVALRGATGADEELLATLKRMRLARGRFVAEPVELLPKTSARECPTTMAGRSAPL
jgi:hypothetical protein